MEKFNIDQGVCLGSWYELGETRVTHVFDAGLCPNALHKRRLDTLRFLMYSRFIEVRVANVHLSLK